MLKGRSNKEQEKVKENKESLIDRVAKKVEKYELSKQRNSVNHGIKFLKIPIIGGFMYIIVKYKQALYFNQKRNALKFEKLTISRDISEANKVKRAMRIQLDEIVRTKKAQTIRVSKKNIPIFYEVIKNYSIDYFEDRIDPEKFVLIVR